MRTHEKGVEGRGDRTGLRGQSQGSLGHLHSRPLEPAVGESLSIFCSQEDPVPLPHSLTGRGLQGPGHPVLGP